MEEISYYNEEEEITLNGNDYTCTVRVTGYYQFSRGNDYDTPPEENYTNVETIVETAYLFASGGHLKEVTNKETLEALANELDAEELLREEK